MKPEQQRPVSRLKTAIPVLSWLPSYQAAWLAADVIAGLTLWGLVVPEAMAYAGIAGLPPQAGLYTLLASLLLYALLGTSRHLVVQATSATAALIASSVVAALIASAAAAAADPATYQAYASAFVLVTALVFLVAGLARLGFITQFLSKPVMSGFVLGLAFFVAVGETDVVEKLKQGYQVGDKTFHVQIDGFNILPYLTGEAQECPRHYFFYADDDGQVTGFRFGDWKIVLLEQRAKTMQVWAEPFVELRIPKIFNLRRDPFERADENSNGYWNWVLEHFYIVPAAAAFIAKHLETFKEFPPRQEAPSFNIDKLIAQMNKAQDGSMH